MLRLARVLTCIFPILLIAGCGGVKEKGPPKDLPKMTPQEKKNMENEMNKMRKMYKKQ